MLSGMVQANSSQLPRTEAESFMYDRGKVETVYREERPDFRDKPQDNELASNRNPRSLHKSHLTVSPLPIILISDHIPLAQCDSIYAGLYIAGGWDVSLHMYGTHCDRSITRPLCDLFMCLYSLTSRCRKYPTHRSALLCQQF